MSLKIPSRNYSYKEFYDQLIIQELEPNRTLKTCCYLTNFNTWEDGPFSLTDIFRYHGFDIQDLGRIKRLFKPYFDRTAMIERQAFFYLYLDPDTGILFCFTDEKTDIIKNVFNKVLRYEKNIYYLFIGASAFYYLSRNIQKIDITSNCVYFSARHLPSYATRGKIRPDYKRTIVYHGTDGDAFDTLIDMREFYGVLPRIMRYRVMDVGEYEVQNIGLFTLRYEYSQEISRLKLFEIVELVLNYILKQKEILDGAEYKLVPVKTKNKTFNIPTIKPWLIDFSSNLEDNIMDEIINILNEEEYPLYNYVSEIGGSFRISGTIIDGRKNSLFSIDVKNNQIIVAPIDNCTFDTFLRFYEVIVENIDPLAEIRGIE